MPFLYEETDSLFTRKSYANGVTIPLDVIAAFALGLFIGLPIGREILKTSMQLTEKEIRKRIEEIRRRRLR